jgi:GNAT superfamily N-acetyltransferase
MTLSVREIRADDVEPIIDSLSAIMTSCVNEGASIGYLTPFGPKDAEAFWTFVRGTLASGARRMLIAEMRGDITGTVQIGLDMPPNGRHRADVMKLMVHPHARKQGIGKALMLAAEDVARTERRSLLVLDTAGDEAERLYVALGWTATGKVPAYARSTEGVLEATTIMWKVLA